MSGPSPDGRTAGSPFPFVVGCGRSGTTLLRAMLDSHPDVAVPDEVSFIVRFSQPQHAVHYGWPRRFDPDRFGALLQTNASFRRWGFERQDLRETLANPPAANFPDAVRRLYRRWAERAGKSRYADKTPMHVLHLNRLAGLFPEARFVHVIRDGRDVASSYMEAGWGPSSVDEAAFDWRRRVSRGRAAGRRLGPARYLELRYEHLVADPEAAARTICRFFELPFDDHMLRYYEHADRVISTTKFQAAHQHLRLPPTVGLRDWRQDMTPASRRSFERIAGPVLAELGYETEATPGRHDRMRVAVQRAIRAARRGSDRAMTGMRVRRHPDSKPPATERPSDVPGELSVAEDEAM